MTPRTPNGLKVAQAARDIPRVHALACGPGGGHSERAEIEDERLEVAISELRGAAVFTPGALSLQRGPVVIRHHRGGDADITGEGGGGLLGEVRLPGFPTKAAQGQRARSPIPHSVWPARDAIRVTVLRICPGQDGLLRHSLQEP